MARGDPRRRLLRSQGGRPGIRGERLELQPAGHDGHLSIPGQLHEDRRQPHLQGGRVVQHERLSGPGFSPATRLSALCKPATREIPARPAAAWASFLLSVPRSRTAQGKHRRGERSVGPRVLFPRTRGRSPPRLNINLGLRNDSTIFGHFGSDQYNNNHVGNLDLVRGLYELQTETPSCEDAGVAPCIPGGALPDGVILSPNGKPSRGPRLESRPPVRIGLSRYRQAGDPRVLRRDLR